MPNRDRGGYAAPLVLGAVVALIAGYVSWGWGLTLWQRQDADRRAYERAAYAEEHIERACVGMDRARLIECVKDAIETSREDQRAGYDLNAQEGMARWAWWLLLSSVATVGVTAIGIYYVRETLVAASAANDVAERTAVIQQRAWLSFDQWHLEGAGDAPDKIDGYYIVIGAKNSGLTPALNVRKRTYATPADGTGMSPLGDGEIDPVIIAPQQPFGAAMVPFTPERILLARRDPITIKIRLTYDTMFPAFSDRVYQVTMRFEYIGLAELDEIKAGRINPGNFNAFPVGLDNIMT